MAHILVPSCRKKTSGLLYFSVAIVVLSLLVFGTMFGFQAYARAFKVETALKSSKVLAPDEPFIIEFSEAMDTELFPGSIAISPEEKLNFAWENNSRRLKIQPAEFWKIGGQYQVEIREARSKMFTAGSAEFAFEIPGYPDVSGFKPVSGEQDVLVDIEDPIVINFDGSLEDFRLKITTSPYQELAYQIDDEKKEIRLLPQEDLERGKKYQIEIFIKYKKENQYQKIHETDFTTKEPFPEKWADGLEERLAQARKFTEPQIKEGKYIDINLTSQIMAIFEGGELLDAYLVSSGKRGMDTPTGTFRIANKFPRAWSKKYGLYMPYWMALVGSGDYGIHELPEWPGGFKEGANHLGIPVSHGCVRLGVGPAKRVYEWSELKTPVVIHY